MAFLLGTTCLHGCASLGALHAGLPTPFVRPGASVTAQAGVVGTTTQNGAPKSVEEELVAGEAALARGEHDVAEASFVRAEALAPGNVRAQLGLADVWLWRGVVQADESALARATVRLAACARACPGSARVNNLLRLLAAERELAGKSGTRSSDPRPSPQP